MSDINDKRIFILNERDEQELYALPILSQSDREAYFYLDEDSQRAVGRLRSLKTKTYFILLLGYFRAKPIIHQFRFKEVQGDLEYVSQKYFPNSKPPRGAVPTSTRSKIANRVLTLSGFSAFKPRVHRRKLMERIRDVATIRIEPQYLFDECLAFFGQERIALAPYTTIQSIISTVLVLERKRIEQVMMKNISELTRVRLNKMLHTKGAISKLSHIKQVAKDFSKTEMSRELEAHSTIKEIYPELKVFVKKLDISSGNLAYYASQVKHKSVYKLRRYTNNQGLIYLACYLYFRYRPSSGNPPKCIKVGCSPCYTWPVELVNI